MEYKIVRVHRNGNVYYAATVRGIYLERASKSELLEAIKYRTSVAKIFGDAVDSND